MQEGVWWARWRGRPPTKPNNNVDGSRTEALRKVQMRQREGSPSDVWYGDPTKGKTTKPKQPQTKSRRPLALGRRSDRIKGAGIITSRLFPFRILVALSSAIPHRRPQRAIQGKGSFQPNHTRPPEFLKGATDHAYPLQAFSTPTSNQQRPTAAREAGGRHHRRAVGGRRSQAKQDKGCVVNADLDTHPRSICALSGSCPSP
jgi:hypothetical protein